MAIRIDVKPAPGTDTGCDDDVGLRATACGSAEAKPPDDAGTHGSEGEFKQLARKIAGNVSSALLEFGAMWFGALQFEHINEDDLPKNVRQEREAKPLGRHFVCRLKEEIREDVEDAGEEIRSLLPQGQRWPIFTVVQCLFTFIIWAHFKHRDGTDLAGLESIWPTQTDLALQWDCIDFRAEIWRWWSYQFSHTGASHVATNCVMMLFLGIPLEGRQGALKLFFMFNVGVFGGACCTFIFSVHTRVVGMSGGIYSLIGIHIADIIMNYCETAWALKKLFVLSFLFLADAANGYFTAHITGTDTISNSAHAGGFVAGGLIGIVVCVNNVVKSHEKHLKRAAFIIGGALVTFSLIWYGTQWPPRNLGGEAWCWSRQTRNRTIFRDNADHCVRCFNDDCVAKWSKQLYLAYVSLSYCDSLGGFDVTER